MVQKPGLIHEVSATVPVVERQTQMVFDRFDGAVTTAVVRVEERLVMCRPRCCVFSRSCGTVMHAFAIVSSAHVNADEQSVDCFLQFC